MNDPTPTLPEGEGVKTKGEKELCYDLVYCYSIVDGTCILFGIGFDFSYF